MNSFNSSELLEIKGHERIRSKLNALLEKKAIPHAMLFTGPEGIGKSLVALEFSIKLLSQNNETAGLKVISGNHPDLHIFKPEGKANLHSLASLKQLSQESAMKPNESSWKIFIIDDAEKMLPSSANAILKTLEEPSSGSIIILISSAPEQLLPTIHSRCHTFSFFPLNTDDVADILQKKNQIEPKEANRIAFLAQGSIKRAQLFLNQSQNHLRNKLIEILIKWPSCGYLCLHEELNLLNELVEKEKESYEKNLRKEFQGVESEIESLVQAKFLSIVQFLLETILYWYRDLDIINKKLHEHLICHQDFLIELKKQEFYPSIERVYKSISKIQLFLERSLKMNNCLEYLFLSLSQTH